MASTLEVLLEAPPACGVLARVLPAASLALREASESTWRRAADTSSRLWKVEKEDVSLEVCEACSER